MAEGFQQFEFTTKQIPQVKGTDGAHWEKMPLANFPPTLDISIPNSTANAVASAMSNIAQSFSDMNNTLQSITQQLQNAACSIGDIVDSLKNAQLFSDQFANDNNSTNIYVRQIGLDPVGTINTQQDFITKVRAILSDTGNSIGQIPNLVPAEIPLNPSIIANSLRSGGTLIDNALGGSSQLLPQGFSNATGIAISAGLGLGTLSNDINFQPISSGGGFSSSTISYSVISILKIDATTAEATFQTSNSVQQNFTIQGSAASKNNGSFKVDPNGVIQVSSLGNTLTRVRYQNPAVVVELSSQATIVFQGTSSISASDTIRGALEQDGYFGPTVPKKTASVLSVLEILVKHNIIGVNPDQADKDKSIALERLVRLNSQNASRIGGIVLVGRAPNLGSLSRKVQALSQILEWLKPLADRLAASALASATNSASGIDFDPTNIDLSKLDSQQNIAKKDVAAAQAKADASGVVDFQMTPLTSNKDNPSPTEFNAWRHYKPVQLIPGLSTLGELESGFEASAESAVSAAINATTGGLAQLVQEGKNSVDTGLKDLAAQGSAIDSLTANINALNDKMVAGLNFLKNQIGVGPISVEGHLIGPKLTLLSNTQYSDAVESALNDITDPNRPTFGPSPSTNVLENQNTLNAALQGVPPPTTSTRLWFGLVLVIIGKDRKDLGQQMQTLADLLSMDSSVVDLPKKKKFSL